MVKSNGGRFMLAVGSVLLVAGLLAPPAASATGTGTWQTLAPAPLVRQEASYVFLNGKFYLIDGKKLATHVYDPATDNWSNAAPLPVKFDHVEGVTVNGKIYIIGGLTGWPSPNVDTVYIFDPATNKWTQGAPMPRGRGAGGVAVYNGNIYYAGGLHNGASVNWFDKYDPVANTWTQMPDMPRTREHFHAQVVNGRFWAMGGRNVDFNAYVTPTDAFNFGTGQWETGYAPIPTPRGGFASAVLGSEIVVFGGEGGGIAHPEVEAYDTSADSWRTLAPMPVPRHGLQGAVCNGGVYLAGGATDQGGGNATAYQDVFFLGTPASCSGGPPPPPPPPPSSIGFGLSSVSGTASGAMPTTLQWGPDGRLYVGHFDGTIRAYTIVRNAANSYSVTSTQVISAVSQIPNHDDDGTLDNGVQGRLMTGLVVVGTAQNPVIYASSSDPRIGGGAEGADLNLDTNSGTISRLTWNGSQWQHVVLVRGLPRSEENHATNGLAYDAATNSLYVAQAGNTNKGGPSNNFAFLPEYALSSAILKIDLNNLGTLPYDIPTLDDPTRANSSGSVDVNDPFGGNDGLNQGKLLANGPVKVFSPGYRNPYDLLKATVGQHAGKWYTIDNGSNAGWGDQPAGEGPGGTCTNAPVGQAETGSSDALHLFSNGYYGGHANPTRGNANNTFGGQSPVPSSDPVECDWRSSKTSETTALSTVPNSTDGLTEYTASNFGGAMTGDLLAASYQARKIVRLVLNGAGTAVTLRDDNFATFNTPHRPLDVTALGDTGPFPGTVWIADFSTDEINVLEPNDFGGGGSTCDATYSTSLDADGDGYSNADEIDNGTNPCSEASVPPDNDGDHLSDLNDPDDDNDGVPDLTDAFAIDPFNGAHTTFPLQISWENDEAPPGGLANTGFTGLMTNGTTNYQAQYDENGMVVGGAAGVFTVNDVPDGDAFKLKNSQLYGFQLGVPSQTQPFQVYGRIVAPFDGLTPTNSQSMGIFLGDGTQSGYVKVTLKGTKNTTEKVNFVFENNDAVSANRGKSITLPGPDYVDLWLVVDPATNKVTGYYQQSIGGVLQAKVQMGNPVTVPSSWMHTANRGLAAGIISTSAGPGAPFPATWDFFHVEAAT